jgi:hypothetical protein
MVEGFPSMLEALGSVPKTKKKNTTKYSEIFSRNF